ncbi:phage antirepressor KilAC domain-containing protein [Oceanobacillus luteolus]|uniref:phage antirepressor KilAC domain-containing protein n=1 Tax=Oceanobacillus luteolus TaxID=1274358 RepID=UPI002041C5F9|nr:phage antirepressor KilAC domain-containing protein [Oceanobacillus luteolus]MCM3739190.1 phage antirepressor KilAC domain-containing protein [Oceanobacillus luteolus]
MNQLQVFQNDLFKVSAKLKDGQVLFEIDHVAKSLGFTQVKNNKEYIRWETVNRYLEKYISQQVGKGDFIPEPLVYKLAFKASNELAEKFQDWLAIEVIPSIRKHGAYMTPETIEQALLNPDTIIQLATNLKEEQQKRIEAEKTIQLQKPKVVYADAVAVSEDTVLVKDLATVLKQKGVDIGTNRLFEWLRNNGYLCKQKGELWNTPTQRSLDLGVMVTKHGLRTGSNGEMKKTRTPKVTGKGQIYFINKFLNQQEVV